MFQLFGGEPLQKQKYFGFKNTSSSVNSIQIQVNLRTSRKWIDKWKVMRKSIVQKSFFIKYHFSRWVNNEGGGEIEKCRKKSLFRPEEVKTRPRVFLFFFEERESKEDGNLCTLENVKRITRFPPFFNHFSLFHILSMKD